MSDENLKIDVEQLVLEQVQIEKASVFHPEYFDPNQIASFVQNVEHEMALNEGDRHYRVRLSFFIETKMKDDSTPASGEFVLQFFFLIKNMDEWITSTTDSNLTVDALLASTLAGISYSTARGVLLTRFQGTAFQNVILPIVSPMQMLGVD